MCIKDTDIGVLAEKQHEGLKWRYPKIWEKTEKHQLYACIYLMIINTI